MSFENFYQKDTEYDRIVRHWWIFIFLIIAVFIGFLFLPDREPPVPKRPLTIAERQQHVTELCSSLPKPEDFELTNKDLPSNFTYIVSVDYFFYTKRSREEILPTFVLWFAQNGWIEEETDEDDSLSFSKDIQTISIKNDFQPDNGYYRITCTEQKVNKP